MQKWVTELEEGSPSRDEPKKRTVLGRLSLAAAILPVPLSHALMETGEGFVGYTLERPISHLLFMDNLKVYAGDMSLVQAVMFILLKAVHVTSEVLIFSITICLLQTYSRLNKVGICLSHVQTQRVVEKLSSGHDKLLKELKANLEVQQACSLTPTVASSSLSIPVDLVQWRSQVVC